MADAKQLRERVEQAVLTALDERVPKLCEQIVEAVLATVAEAVPREVPSSFAALNVALAGIHERGAQAEILVAMLDGVAQFSGRVALFVVRGAAAQGWQARGLAHNDGIKAFSVDATAGLAGQASQTRALVSGTITDFDRRIPAELGAPVEDKVLVLPLVVRNKVAGLVYADAGAQSPGKLDAAAVEILVRAAAAWIELSGVRKASGAATDSPAPAAKAAAASAVAAAQPAGNAVASPSGPVAPPPAPVPSPVAAAAPTSAPAPASTQSPAVHLSPEAEEGSRKAKRFAKLLVEEIKLYNEAKVTEGRQKKNLYALLKDDIEKSRASYEKRYGQTAAATADYFTQELIRILAHGDESLLGSMIRG